MTQDEIRERVIQFKTMKLPGQPQVIHIGTLELIADMQTELARMNLELALEKEVTQIAIRHMYDTIHGKKK